MNTNFASVTYKRSILQDDISLLIVFNHHHRGAKRVVEHYNSRFTSRLHFAAPFSELGTIRYSNGSYLWQGAIVEYLRNLNDSDGYSLVIHDDLVLNPSLNFSELKVDETDFIRFVETFKLQGQLGLRWVWQFRALTNWFTPKQALYGTGIDDVVDVLKNSLLYQANQVHIDSLENSKLKIYNDDPPHYLMQTWIDHYFPGRTEFDFGLPLYCGVSDFFMFPNSYANIVEDFLRRSIECGLFVEIAIPTLIEWLNLPVYHEIDRQLFLYGEDCARFQNLQSVEDLESFFNDEPHLLSIHPVKFSGFPELREELRDE